MPNPTAAKDERRAYCGYHVTWCTNRDDEFTLHSEEEPYCSKQLHGVSLIPEGGVERGTVWVQPTSAFTHGQFTPAEYARQEQTYDGVELNVELWRGPERGWDEPAVFRLTSDAARSLAATLIRAADIEQGLTR